ncbi:urea transporter 2 isoform X2 [Hyalella azteca]|uniref:Urea transporter 2 isoform X2 n=1 Tax=Hyalella azteca TaxID=294128 RepID=A0A8B7P9B3_HYAAZ|nr:urea transporter 2 isoform X2 [Hyalella azteca]
MANRRNSQVRKWLRWFGDMNAIRCFLFSKSWWSPWFPAKLTNAVLRAFGVVAFANNPLSGFLIMAAMMASDVIVGVAGLLSATVAVICSKLQGAPDHLVCDGLTAFNSLLVGAICTAVLPDLLNLKLHFYHVLLSIPISIITCYVDLGLSSLMSPCQLPAQSIPFNLVATGLVLSLRGRLYGYGLKIHGIDTQGHGQMYDDAFRTLAQDITEVFEGDQTELQWVKVLEGSVLAAGQVYGAGNMASSIIIWLAFFLYSPILSVVFYLGSIIGSCLAVFLSPGSLSEVYAGLWSYNSMLAAGGSVFFLQPSLHVAVVAVLGACMAVFTQAAVMNIFAPTQLPVLSYPFNVVITILLAISTQRGTTLTMLTNRSFPEQHIYERLKGTCEADNNADENAPEMKPFQV